MVPLPLEEYTVPNGAQHSPPREISKSRTFGVFSSISQSFSRASLSRATTRGRNVSGSSGTTTTPVPNPSRSSKKISRFGRRSLEPTLENESEKNGPKNAPLPSLPNDPRLVSKAMPSQYWTGRFTALHDRLESELLETQNLNIVMEGLLAKSSFHKKPGHSSTPSAGALNNPSTSVYAATRLPRHSLGSYQPRGKQGPNSDPTKSFYRIHHSATSNAVLETAQKSSAQKPHTSPVTRVRGLPRSLPASRLPSYDQAISYGKATSLPFTSTVEVVHGSDSDSDETKKDHARSMSLAMAVATAAALTDDNSRRRRVFVQLESCCVTDEARRSLYKWQQSFARHENRDDLLPPGGTMESPQRKASSGGIVSRLEGFLHRGEGGKSLTVGKRGGQQRILKSPLAVHAVPPRKSFDGRVPLRGSKTGPEISREGWKLKKPTVFSIF
ncbi:hypothetical protein B0T14DRAFT_523244 [Immersiella caudata]|uniref:Uncharacterized protein n=1 Tax=Immersiella caudata TaxID=314043 RepID=A0AA39WJE7_9PEZI|nr:hypothetical protein B0T14DRAFT_523244 [Immersiella caudata]